MNVFAAAAAAWERGEPAALATVIASGGSTPRSAGARMLVHADGRTVGTIGGGALEHRVQAEALEAIADGRPRRFEAHLVQDLGMCCGGRTEVWIEPLRTRVPLVVFGAGHVAHALVPLLQRLDFDVTVVDDRDELLTEARFPTARRIDGDPVAFAASLPDDPERYWLVVTHDHALDQRLVEHLLPRPCAWLGMIGSKGKVARFLVRFRAAGIDPALFPRLCAPVGLDLGAETPAEIAVSIAAELIRVRRGTTRPPEPLSRIPLAARGGDGRATAPALQALEASEAAGD